MEPDVLLLDEPLSNLDAKLRLETRREIRRIQSDLQITSIYVTHDQEEALSMADEIAIMNDGRIEQIGSPREIYSSPANSFVAGFIGETNFIYGEVRTIDGETGTLVVSSQSGEEIRAKAIHDDFSTGQKVMCSIRPENIKLLDKTVTSSKGTQLFPAEVIHLTYYGAIEHYVLKGFGGMDIKVTNFNTDVKKRLVGEKVYITFDPTDVDVFPF